MGALVFDLFTFCCLIWQLTLILQVYYAYKVTNKTAIFIPRDLDSFDFNICVKFSELLDYDRLKKETKRDWSYAGNYKEYLQNMTVRELFEYTPKAEDVVAKISFKTLSSSRVMSIKEKDSNVKVNKYLSSQILLHDWPQERRPLDLQNGCSFLFCDWIDKEDILYPASLKMDAINISLRRRDNIPLGGLMISPYIYRGYSEKSETSNYSDFSSTHYSMIIHALPPPYETMCYDYEINGFIDELDRMERCTINKSMAIFKKLSYNPGKHGRHHW